VEAPALYRDTWFQRRRIEILSKKRERREDGKEIGLLKNANAT
jgi:hypothetical protein